MSRAAAEAVTPSLANAAPASLRLQRKCACEETGETCARCADKRRPQRKAANTNDSLPVTENIGHTIRSQGRPLDKDVRQFMERYFEHDFSGVRVHTDSDAGASARGVDALAYTVGHDVVFDTGRYAPQTSAGRALLTHELAHVVQQSSASWPHAGPDAPLERAADEAASRVSVGRPAPAQPAAGFLVARQRKPGGSAPAGHLSSDEQQGRVVLTFDGAVVVTILYKAETGRAEVGASGDAGHESIVIVTPANSEASMSVTPQYTTLLAAGRLSLSDTPADAEFENVKGVTTGPQAVEYVGKTFRVIGKSVSVGAPRPVAQTKAPRSATAAQATPPTSSKSEEVPAKSAAQLIDDCTALGILDEEKLGALLLKSTLRGDSAVVGQTLDALASTNRDDVAVALVSHASTPQLNKMAESEEGRKLILRLYDELTSGHLGGDEKQQAERLMQARAERGDPAKLIDAPDKAMVIPFSSIGFTKLSSASLTVRRLDNGKIWVKSHLKVEHWKDAKRLPTKDFALGLDGTEIDPDEVVGLYLYDEGGKTIYVPAIYLLQLGNQEDTKAYSMIGEALFTGFTLGAGGGAAAGGRAAAGTWGARGLAAVKWADRAATVVGIASTLINDHRGLIIERFGKDGEDFLKHWQTVESVVAVYGLARGAVALGQTTASLRTSLKNWRARQPQLKGLSPADEAALNDIARNTERTIDELEEAEKAAAKGATSPRSGAPEAPGTAAPAPSALVDDVTPATKQLYEAKPELKNALQRNPRAAAALKKCKSPCFPDYATEAQVAKIEKLMEAAEKEGTAIPRQHLADYFRSAEGNPALKTVEQRRAMLDNLITHFPDYKQKLPGFLARADEEEKAFRKLFPDVKSAGDPIRIGEHGGASRNREALNLSGKEHESAHITPKSVMKQVPGYDPSLALTRMLQRSNHRGSAGLDHFWKSEFDAMRKARPDKKATAQEIYDVLARAIEKTKGIPEGERRSLIARLHDEMFKESALTPATVLDIPRGYVR